MVTGVSHSLFYKLCLLAGSIDAGKLLCGWSKKLHVISHLPYAGSKNGWSTCARHKERKTITFSVLFRRAFFNSLRSAMTLVQPSEVQNLPQRPSSFHFSSFQSLKNKNFQYNSLLYNLSSVVLWARSVRQAKV